MKQRHTFVFLFLAWALSLLGSFAQAAEDGGVANDVALLERVASLSLLQVRMGAVASRYASATDVKTFGARMATEFSAIGEEIVRLSPSTTAKLSDADEGTVRYLGALPGAALDREYTSLALDQLAGLAKGFRALGAGAADVRVKELAAGALSRIDGFTREGERVLNGLPRPVLK